MVEKQPVQQPDQKKSIEAAILKQQLKKRRIETNADFNTYLITPILPDAKIRDYHKYVTKDTAVSFFPKGMGMKTVFLCQKYFQVIADFVFIGCDTMAMIYDAELKSLVNAMRSIEGFERTKLTEIGIVKKDSSAPKNRGWFGGRRK